MKKGEYKHTKESIEKMKATHVGKQSSFKGRHHSEKTKLRLRQINLGKRLSKETKNKISKRGKGRSYYPRSELGMIAFKKKMKGRIPWNKGLPSPWVRNNPQIFKKGMVSLNKGKRGLYKGLRGENHPSWKGGNCSIRMKVTRLSKYKHWRDDVFKRDNYKCINGQNHGNGLQADHIIPLSYILKRFNIQTVEEAENCSMLWDVTNGRTLCKDCHLKTPTWGGNSIHYKAISIRDD